jgi:hypothetical protein
LRNDGRLILLLLRDDKNLFRRPSIIIPITAKMADAQVTLRTRKFIRNPLLARKQMVV